MRKLAQPLPFGSDEIRNEGIGASHDESRGAQIDSSHPFDTLVPEKSVLDGQDIMSYEGGIISPTDAGGQTYNWAKDHKTKKQAQVTIWKGATSPVASFYCGVADNIQEKVIGLQSYKGLDSTAGLLFTYASSQDVLYHMGTVSFPIDIIFIDNNSCIKRIYSNIQPGSLATFGCADVKYVLEIYGGLSNRLGISEGYSIDVNPSSTFLRTASLDSLKAGFNKRPILTYHSFKSNSTNVWNSFPIINLDNKINKYADNNLTTNTKLFELSPLPKKIIITAFFMDGLIASAPNVGYLNNYTEVDDTYVGKITTDICGRTVVAGKTKDKDPRVELLYGDDTLVRDSFKNFMNIKSNDFYNKEVGKFFDNIRAAHKNGNKILFCTSANMPGNLLNMIQYKMAYLFGDYVDLSNVEILSISKNTDSYNIVDIIRSKYPYSKIEIRADTSILKRAGIPVSDDIKRNAQIALKSLNRAIELVEESIDKMHQNKVEYEKHEGDVNVIEKSKGQYHQSIKRNQSVIKSYLIKIRDSIRVLNEIKDITTTLEVIDGLVSSSKAASNAAELVFDMKDKMNTPDFVMQFSSHTQNYESAAEDLISSIERARDYINSNILGIIVLSE